MKARQLAAIAGIAIATAAVVFVRSLVATGDRQAPAVAEALLRALPVAPDAHIARFALDYRPGGQVMQGPPLMALAATEPGLAPGECVVARSLFAPRHLEPPPVGSELTLVGERGAYKLKIAAYRDWERPARGYPNCFVAPETAATIGEHWREWTPLSVAEIAPFFQSEDQRNFSRARPLLLWAAALTALALLVNSLLLSIEARRKELAILRMVGMTRGRVAIRVLGEALALAVPGGLIGVALGLGALALYVGGDPALFPMGMAIDWRSVFVAIIALVPVAALATLMALRPALAVRPLEAASDRTPRRRRLGMPIAFGFGFGAFVAVEVWGASLMSSFMPSPEWPEAIVSILPAGVSGFDLDRARAAVHGVRRLHELQPLQVNFEPLVEMTGFKSARPGGGKSYRNALLLASDWLPPFRFAAGERSSALAALAEGDNCLITAMMARARNLKLGDDLRLVCGRGLKMTLKVVGILDLNWHLVTSRALVRGLNRMPMNTDGPVFVSFDTLAACDARPQNLVRMTHLWLDYEPEFLAEHGALGAAKLVEADIARAFATEGNTVRIHARDEISAGTLAHGNDIIGSMAKVPFIFLAVIALGFIAMLVASADSRRREFLVLTAVGATRWQLAKALLGEALHATAYGIVFGLGGGTLVGWLFTHGTRAAMANWGIPPAFAFPARVIAEGALGAVLFALMVAIPAALIIVDRRRK